jgi:mRNA-degrading endonuclease RelE of RelBE toxin-antitoxin system
MARTRLPLMSQFPRFCDYLPEPPKTSIGIFPLDIWASLAYKHSVSQRLITVAETPLFVRQATDVWDDAEREAFVNFIAGNPEAGDVIPETGGVRKIRWGGSGKGRRGGVRVIYFYHNAHRPLYLLMVYAKARREDLAPDEKRTVRKLAVLLKGKPE